MSQLTQKELRQIEHFQPMWKIVLSQFMQHKMAVAGLCTICLFVVIALSAPLIAKLTGLDPERQNPLSRYLPPGSVGVMPPSQKEDALMKFQNRNPEAAKALGEQLLSQSLVFGNTPDEALRALIFKEESEIMNVLAQVNTSEAKAFVPTADIFETYHVFGTDELGRDVLIRLIYGTRVSMTIGLLAALAATVIGLIIGALTGFYGGIIDSMLMRVTDSLLSLPTIPVLIVLAAVDLNKIPAFKEVIGGENEAILKLVVILVAFSWMTTARLVRGSILSLKEREFILAAKTLGAKDSTIILRHLFPNVISVLLVSVTLKVGDSILFEAAMSFLGLGVQPPTPSWGNMLFNAQDLISEAPFLAILPGLLILATTLSFNYLGDGLQDAIDPKAIRR